MSNEQNATPIDDQLIIITAIARAAGYDDGAAWIEKQATAFVEQELVESEPSVMASDPSASKPYQWELCVQCGRAKGASGTTSICAQSIDADDTTHKWTTDVPNRFADPEPSRTEAVASILTPDETRQAYASVPESLTVGQLNRAVRNLREEIHRIRIEGQAALTEAERKLATEQAGRNHWCTVACNTAGQLAVTERKLAVVQGHYTALESQNFDLTHQLEAAEQRAKDAQQEADIARSANASLTLQLHKETDRSNGFEFAHDLLRYDNAALARKLATAWEGIERAMSAHGDPGTDHEAVNTMRNVLSASLAAIDAPAGEERDGIDILRRKAHDELDKCLDEARMGSYGWLHDHDEYYAGDRVYAHVHNYAKACAKAVTPPPEPANAQGSEAVGHACDPDNACPRCGRHKLGCDEAHYHGVGGLDCCSPNCWCKKSSPSVPRFTAAEARAEAKAIRKSEPLNAPVAATLDAYADLLDRDDALDRAAVEAVRSFDMLSDQYNISCSAIDDLRSVLAQRARKVE